MKEVQFDVHDNEDKVIYFIADQDKKTGYFLAVLGVVSLLVCLNGRQRYDFAIVCLVLAISCFISCSVYFYIAHRYNKILSNMSLAGTSVNTEVYVVPLSRKKLGVEIDARIYQLRVHNTDETRIRVDLGKSVAYVPSNTELRPRKEL